VDLRHAEDGHDRVADELLDHAAVALDDPLHLLEVAGEQASQRLRVGRLAERRRPRDVAEQNRDGLSLLAPARCRRERSTALLAEFRPLGVLVPAACADRHA